MLTSGFWCLHVCPRSYWFDRTHSGIKFMCQFKSAAASVAVLLFIQASSYGQTDAPQRLGSQYIPIDATATVRVSVAEVLSSPQTEMYPVEVADAWCNENIGVLASEFDEVKVVIGAPGPGGTMFALIVTLSRDLDVTTLNPKLVDATQAIDVDGYKCYPIVGPPGIVLHAKDARTVVIATENYVGSVLRAAESPDANGPLAKMAEGVSHAGHLTALVAVEPLRPMLNGMLQMQADKIPPPLVEFTKVPDLLDAVLVRVNLDDEKSGMQLVMLGTDEAAAEELSGLISRGLEMGRQIGLAEATSDIDGNDAVSQASRQYAERLSNKIVALLTPTRDGRKLSLSGSATSGLATQGVLVGLLLPAVQAARQAARRTSSSNNLKMIGLAMHNHHDTHRAFPGDIKREDGTPLLSWRVAILPFLEQNALYEAFHLDEPWDSPHNIQLVDKMPQVYVHPGIPAPPGFTVYQRPSGEDYIHRPSDAVSFRDITDGTSNTIMAVETVGEEAIQWTKPADVAFDSDDPLGPVVDGSRPGFNALFGDGSVRFFSNAIDPNVFMALLTRNGAEIVRP